MWRYWKETKEAAMSVASGDVQKSIKIFTDKYNAYSGRHNFLCNLGYSRTNRKVITLTFENTGIYTYDKFRVVCQPVQGIQEKAQELGAETLQNINQEENQITGEITVSGKRALVLAIPYSKGFTAYVDGEKAELKKANTMYMADRKSVV